MAPMSSKTTPATLRAVTQRVVDSFTAQGALFTALDVSNAVKTTLPDVRHREVAPLVRELFERHAMGDYQHALIDVLAEGRTPTQAYLYHLPEHSPELYDDTMRNQLAIPPVSTSTARSDDAAVTAHSVEAPAPVGRDGRARVSRQILMNAGVVGDEVSVRINAEAGEVLLFPADEDEDDADDGDSAVVEYEHPSLLHVPRGLMARVFEPGTKVVARVEAGFVKLVRA